MNLQTLVVTVDQHDFSLIENMNIQTDTIVGNQSDYEGVQTAQINGCSATMLSSVSRGVGQNRNTVMAAATADYCIFADDDMRFVDGYPNIVKEAVSHVPEADVLIFNLIEKNPTRHSNTEFCEINNRNYGKYGAARYVVNRKSIADAGITFSLLFGGGAKYSAGEDSIFLKDCLNRGLKIMAVPYAIAEIDQSAESTWFTGFNEKYFHDRGALYACLYPSLAPLYCGMLLIKHRNKFRKSMPLHRAFSYMLSGIRDYKKTGVN